MQFKSGDKTPLFLILTFELFVGIGNLRKNRPCGRLCKFCPSSLRSAAALNFLNKNIANQVP